MSDFPPPVKYLWVCPACDGVIVGSYNVDPMRKKCSKTWHRAMAERVEYVWSRLAVAAVANAMRDGSGAEHTRPEGGRCLCEGDHDEGCPWGDAQDADDAITDDARRALAALINEREAASARPT